MHSKDAKEAAKTADVFFQVLFTKVKHASYYLRYDGTGQELTDRPESLSWLEVTSTG